MQNIQARKPSSAWFYKIVSLSVIVITLLSSCDKDGLYGILVLYNASGQDLLIETNLDKGHVNNSTDLQKLHNGCYAIVSTSNKFDMDIENIPIDLWVDGIDKAFVKVYSDNENGQKAFIKEWNYHSRMGEGHQLFNLDQSIAVRESDVDGNIGLQYTFTILPEDVAEVGE